MDILLMILAATVVLGFLVLIHEGGHFLAARAFKVRVTELMIGLPGPCISIQRGETSFGLTAIPLGGYARVCGMEPGHMSAYLQVAMTHAYARGTASVADIACDCGISYEDAYEALEELSEWGTLVRVCKKPQEEIYAVPAFKPTKRQLSRAQKADRFIPRARIKGEPCVLDDPCSFFESEYQKQYRALPAWKRMVIVLAGPFVNLVFALFAFVLIYSVIGVDMSDANGQLNHYVLSPIKSIQAGFTYIIMVVQAVISLFNPQTIGETISQSTSLVGIAVMSKSAFESGLINALLFTSMLSVSLGIMNLLPIPPLDGGRFVIEIYQRIRGKMLSARVLNYLSFAGVALFTLLFIVMMNQDIQRFIFGNW